MKDLNNIDDNKKDKNNLHANHSNIFFQSLHWIYYGFSSLLNYCFYFYKNSSQELKKRALSEFIFGSILLFITFKGEIYYRIPILIIGMLMMQEWIIMIHKLYTENINFYYSYRKYGMIYIIILCVSLLLIRESLQGLKITIWLFISIWSLDITVFCFSKKYNKIKLSPEINEIKTFEGVLLGILISTIISYIFYLIFTTNNEKSFSSGNFLILSLIIMIMAQIGNFIILYIKKINNVQNSNMLFDDNGIIGKFDSISIVAPFIYILLFINNGIIF